MLSLYPQVGSGADVMFAAWIASGNGRGIGTERGIRGRSSRDRLPVLLPIWLFASFVVVAFEKSDRYVEAAAVTVVAVLVMEYGYVSSRRGAGSPGGAVGSGPRGRSGNGIGSHVHLRRRAVIRVVAMQRCWGALLLVVVGAIAGASGSRLVQYGIMGAVTGTAIGAAR